MSIADLQSGLTLLRLGLKGVEPTKPEFDDRDIAAVSDARNIMTRIQYIIEALRQDYDDLMDERKAPRDRYFNFDAEGNCTEVSADEYAGTIGGDDYEDASSI